MGTKKGDLSRLFVVHMDYAICDKLIPITEKQNAKTTNSPNRAQVEPSGQIFAKVSVRERPTLDKVVMCFSSESNI